MILLLSITIGKATVQELHLLFKIIVPYRLLFVFCFTSAPSAPPTGITATNINATAVAFSWLTLKGNDTNGVLVAFAVKLVRLDTSMEIQRNISSSLQNLIATGLKSYTNYSIRIAAVNGAGIGPYSTSVVIETLKSGKFPFLWSCKICSLVEAHFVPKKLKNLLFQFFCAF